MKKEKFELRRYSHANQSNLAVDVFTCVDDTWHTFDVSKMNVSIPDAVFQVYPHDPTKCFYEPFPAPGISWFLIGNKTQRLASVDCHDYYAFFVIPSGTTRLDWIQATSWETALNKLLLQ